MGPVMSSVLRVFTGGETAAVAVGDPTTIGKDLRRRNSMTFHISKFLTHESDDFTDLLDVVKEEFEARLLGVTSNSRDQSEIICMDSLKLHDVQVTNSLILCYCVLLQEFADIADQVAQGNLKELQRQVILNFRNMGR